MGSYKEFCFDFFFLWFLLILFICFNFSSVVFLFSVGSSGFFLPIQPAVQSLCKSFAILKSYILY